MSVRVLVSACAYLASHVPTAYRPIASFHKPNEHSEHEKRERNEEGDRELVPEFCTESRLIPKVFGITGR
jgi:hypothetical protein